MPAEQQHRHDMVYNLPPVPEDQLYSPATITPSEARDRALQAVASCSQTDVYAVSELIRFAWNTDGEVEIEQIPYADQSVLWEEIERDIRVEQLEYASGMLRITFGHDRRQYREYQKQVGVIIDRLMATLPKGAVVTMDDFEACAKKYGTLPADEDERQRFGRIFTFSNRIVIDPQDGSLRLWSAPVDSVKKKVPQVPHRGQEQAALTQSLGSGALEKLLSLRASLDEPEPLADIEAELTHSKAKTADTIVKDTAAKGRAKAAKVPLNIEPELSPLIPEPNPTPQPPLPKSPPRRAIPIPSAAREMVGSRSVDELWPPPMTVGKALRQVEELEYLSSETLKKVFDERLKSYLKTYSSPALFTEGRIFRRVLGLPLKYPASSFVGCRAAIKEVLRDSRWISQHENTGVYVSTHGASEPGSIEAMHDKVESIKVVVEQIVEDLLAVDQGVISGSGVTNMAKNMGLPDFTVGIKPILLQLFRDNPRVALKNGSYRIFSDEQAQLAWTAKSYRRG